MVTVAKSTFRIDSLSKIENYVKAYRGLSTDTKPAKVAENATFLELDTGIAFYFSHGTWHEFAENKPEGMVITSALVG